MIFDPLQGLLNPVIALVFVLDGDLYLHRPGQDDSQTLWDINYIVVPVCRYW